MNRATLPPVTLDCARCGTEFTVNGAKAKAYDARSGRTVKYCSKACSDLGRRSVTHFTCVQCGESKDLNRRKRPDGTDGSFIYQQKFCSGDCKAAHRSANLAAANGQFFNCKQCGADCERTLRVDDRGRKRGWTSNSMFCSLSCRSTHVMSAARGQSVGHLDKNGYRIISVGGVQVAEHRYVMEQKIGRPLLPDETVHHIDGRRAFNDERNLELWSSRHGKGQRVSDKIAAALELFELYPETLRAAGYVRIEQHQPDITMHTAEEYLDFVMMN